MGSMCAVTNASKARLTADELRVLDAWWRAANYLSVGQIYLLDNPLLHEPLRPEHVKPRLLGHWGTTPGLNFIYAHMNRAIGRRELNAIYVTGPGHGGQGLVASAYLDGTYSEVYPHIGRDAEGLRRLVRQYSFPGGIPSHVAPDAGVDPRGGESSATRCCTPTARCSTTRTCSRCASSATGRPRPDRWRRAGTRTSS
jgi:xylulose-5-phosphate/fructose-6-phosphate phosphoketolase